MVVVEAGAGMGGGFTDQGETEVIEKFAADLADKAAALIGA